MQKSDDLRKHAENCAELAEQTSSQPEKKRLERLAAGWQEVASHQDWLDGGKKSEVQESPAPE